MINKKLTSYGQAINEVLDQLLESDARVFLIGQGVTSPWYVGNTTKGLIDKYGKNRVIDTPISENAITGIAVGASMTDQRPIVVHPRMDFMYYAFDPIINSAATWNYMFGGHLNCPITIRAIINRGGSQAAQHSQAIHALFAHIPGLKVVMPSSAYDAKGLMVASVNNNNPIIYIEDRWLYEEEEEIPTTLYEVPIGKGKIKREGSDLTIIATSYMVSESLKAIKKAELNNISVELIDPRTIKPLDINLILKSVQKTKRLLIVDAAWQFCGISAEISAQIAERPLITKLKSPIKRLTLPEAPAPASIELEKAYYLNSDKIYQSIKSFF